MLGPADLNFTAEETQALLGPLIGRQRARAVHRDVEGWPLALGLLAVGDGALLPTDLVVEMISSLPEPLLRAAADWSVLDHWSAASVGALNLRWLPDLLRSRLPILPLGGGAYRPHRLLREVLRGQLLRRPARFRALHALQAERLEAQGEPLQAVKHHADAGNAPEVVRLTRRLLPELQSTAQYPLLCQLLEPLQPAMRPPVLERALALALIETGRGADGEHRLRQLDSAGLLDAASLLALARRQVDQGYPAAAPELIRRARELSQGQPQAQLTLTRAYLSWATLENDEAMALAIQAGEQAEVARVGPALAEAIHMLALCRAAAGDFPGAVTRLERTVLLYETLGLPVRSVAARGHLATMYLHQNRLGAAQAQLEQAIDLAGDGPHPELPGLYAQLAAAALQQQQILDALYLLRRANAASDQMAVQGPVRASVWLQTAEAAHLAGAALEAQVALDCARLALGAAEPNVVLLGELAFVEGLFAWAAGHTDIAQERLRLARSEESNLSTRVRAGLFLADLARQAGTLRRQQVNEVVNLLGLLRSDAALRRDASILNPLYRELVRRRWWVERFGPMLAKSDRISLEIVTLGRSEVRVGGRAVRFPFAKCLDLLVWLALNGPATRREIVNALWNGSVEASHSEYFRVVIRRLRAALADQGMLTFNPLPFEGGVYRLAGALEVTLDLVDLEAAARTQDLSRWEQILGRSEGPFLTGRDGEWIELLRTRAADLTIHLSLSLGRSQEDTGPQDAVTTYRRTLQLDPLSEEAHRGLIRSLEKAEDHAGAKWARFEFRRIWRETFGNPPALGEASGSAPIS